MSLRVFILVRELHIQKQVLTLMKLCICRVISLSAVIRMPLLATPDVIQRRSMGTVTSSGDPGETEIDTSLS